MILPSSIPICRRVIAGRLIKANYHIALGTNRITGVERSPTITTIPRFSNPISCCADKEMVAVVRVNRKSPHVSTRWEIATLCWYPCRAPIVGIVKDMWILGVTKQLSAITKFSSDVPQREWADLETSRAAIRCF